MKKKWISILVLGLLVGCESGAKSGKLILEDDESEMIKEEEITFKYPVMFQLDELPEEELRYIMYLGREDTYDVYYSTPSSIQEDNSWILTFYYTNPSTFEVVKIGEVESVISAKIKLINDKVYVMKPDAMIQIGNQFEEREEIKMPELIANEENLYGFDISDDLSQFIYSNQAGLWYLSDKEAEPVLLREPVKFKPNPLIDFGYYINPTFINEAQDIIVEVGAYEGSAGYLFCDLKTLTCDNETSKTQQDLLDLAQNQRYLQVATPTGEFIPWRYHWVNLKTKMIMDEMPITFETEEGQTRQIDDYVQLGNQMFLAIGTRNQGKFLPKWIDIEVYQIEEDGTLTYIKHLERVEDINLTLMGVTPEGKVIYSHENYNAETTSKHLKLVLSD